MSNPAFLFAQVRDKVEKAQASATPSEPTLTLLVDAQKFIRDQMSMAVSEEPALSMASLAITNCLHGVNSRQQLATKTRESAATRQVSLPDTVQMECHEHSSSAGSSRTLTRSGTH